MSCWPELFRGEILLVEQVDRLSRLTAEDRERLKSENDRSARARDGAGSAGCPG
jgi:DNA invertase Pin-like site-specific DNA recombinase